MKVYTITILTISVNDRLLPERVVTDKKILSFLKVNL
jgi:hypothetical protein